MPVAPRVWLRRVAQGLACASLTAPLSPSAHGPQAQDGEVSGWAVKGTMMYGGHTISATLLQQTTLPPSSLSPLGWGWGSLFSPSCLLHDPMALRGGSGLGGPRYSKALRMATGAQSCKFTTGYETVRHCPDVARTPVCLHGCTFLPELAPPSFSAPPCRQLHACLGLRPGAGSLVLTPPAPRHLRLISQQLSSPLAPLTPHWPHDPLALLCQLG